MPRETILKYSDMDKDGQVDDDFEKKVALAKMLLEEDRWAVEKEERQNALQGAMQDRERKAQEAQTLQQMISSADDMLGQVTIENEGPLQ